MLTKVRLVLLALLLVGSYAATPQAANAAARKATITGLTSGQVYEFRVAAKNKSGTGTWSDVVVATPN